MSRCAFCGRVVEGGGKYCSNICERIAEYEKGRGFRDKRLAELELFALPTKPRTRPTRNDGQCPYKRECQYGFRVHALYTESEWGCGLYSSKGILPSKCIAEGYMFKTARKGVGEDEE